MSVKNNPLNCRKPLKLSTPQRSDERYADVTVTKVEKKRIDGARLNPKHQQMGNRQRSLEERNVQRLRALQAIGKDSGGHPEYRVKI